MYGLDTLKRIAKGSRSERLQVVRIGIDAETEDLEKLIALVTVVKGRCDYGAE